MKTLAMLFTLLALTAWADQLWRAHLVVPVQGSKVFCFAQKGANGGINCSESVRVAYGVSLADGGTYNNSDGGQPLVSSSVDELATFPDLNYQLHMGINNCFSVATVSTDAGTCDAYAKTSTP
jgi:hypothetical protein